MGGNDEKIVELQGQINAYQQLLTNSDYKALKHADGVLTDAEYEETRELRQHYRDEINRLQKEIEDLEK